ncbi:MAG TPA: hypothetical protein PKW82_02495 [Spirochaetales bacterium]|nr:hypothetical protein [Spirochaetales bacterium]
MAGKIDVKKEILNALVVAGTGVLLLALAFALYFGLFAAFESFANRDGSYRFVGPLRVGYGLVLCGLCAILYRTRAPEPLKAASLAAALGTLWISLGVQFHERPRVFLVLAFASGLGAVALLARSKRRWYHFLAPALAAAAAFAYL